MRRESHVSHFSLSEAQAFAASTGVPNTYFTHISHQMGDHAETDRELPARMQLANDGLKLEA
ncbi:MAG: hypothetical protein ACO2YM_07570 [Schleiferiaceae bacterium]